jgi:hypothetical protein
MKENNYKFFKLFFILEILIFSIDYSVEKLNKFDSTNEEIKMIDVEFIQLMEKQQLLFRLR